jgi:hypothetical protein
MSNISLLASRVGGGGVRGIGVQRAPYHYLAQGEGQGGVCVPSPWIHLAIDLKNVNCLIRKEHTEWQRPLRGVHSIVMARLVRMRGGVRPPLFTLFTITHKVAV